MSSVTIDETFAALADPTRVAIVMRLSRGPASVSELAEPHDMSLRAVMKHVAVLEDAGIVRTDKHGRVRQCALDHTGIDEAARWLEQVRTLWERRLDRLERYARRQEK